MDKNPRYHGKRIELVQSARRLDSLGWEVGFAKGKGPAFHLNDVLSRDDRQIAQMKFDGISIILDDNLIVVDIDAMTWSLPPYCVLPPTLKERSKRGIHLFYDCPKGIGTTKIKWAPNVDILCAEMLDEYDDGYGYGQSDWGQHVICSPTDGYSLIWPEEFPRREDIARAPDWLVAATREKPDV